MTLRAWPGASVKVPPVTVTPPSVERRFGATSPAPDTVHGRALTSIESASLLRFSTVRLFVAPAVAARSTSSGATTRPP